jgi:hypothetical protein
MHFTRTTIGSREALYQAISNAQVARLGPRTLWTDVYIHQQADQILANKQARDMHVDWRAARGCGCVHCRRAYRRTLDFYASLGSRPPRRKGGSTR